MTMVATGGEENRMGKETSKVMRQGHEGGWVGTGGRRLMLVEDRMIPRKGLRTGKG